MKIGTRLFISLAIPIAVLIAVFATIEDAASRGRTRAEVRREGRSIARTVQLAAAYALRDRQVDDVRRLIDAVSGRESILGVRLVDTAGDPIYGPPTLVGVPPTSPARLRALPADGRIVSERLVLGGRPVIAWRAALAEPAGTGLGAVEVFERESFVDEDARASSRAIAIFAVLLIGAAALTVLVVTRVSVAGPIEDLVATARGIAQGNWAARVPVRRHDELGRLAVEFNRMCDRLERAQASLFEAREERRRAESSLRDAERLASLGRFATGMAHEIGTPLNVISGRAESLLRRAERHPELRRGLSIIAAQIERISRIVRGTLDFARVRDMRIAPTDLVEVLGRVLELLDDRLAAQGIRVETLIESEVQPIAADADRLQQVFLNLALNAADAMPGGGRLSVRVAVERRSPPASEAASRSCAAVSFTDTGCGIAPENLPRLFEPFFTTKEVGGGTGMGLAISYGIVQEHGGWMDVSSTPGRGTRMTIFLPLQARRARVAEPEAAA